MFKFLLTVLFISLGHPLTAFGQKATEIYIPMGQSPGNSGVRTALGTIQAVNAQTQSFTMTSEEGESYTVTIAEGTKIWLDRSKIREKNVEGSLADCRLGRRIEVLFSGADKTGTVVWIKVEITSG